jgi:hypothetical protein
VGSVNQGLGDLKNGMTDEQMKKELEEGIGKSGTA